MIQNDLHVHSVQSACGIHTLQEIVQIAANKDMALVNISDHGPASGRYISFGVLLNKDRLPNPVFAFDGSPITVLRGIEASILTIEGRTDIPATQIPRFDLISAGFHSCGDLPKNGSEVDNTRALGNALANNPIDILTHPCIGLFPLDIAALVELSKSYGFALEVNNTNLRVGKTNRDKLRAMIDLAVQEGAALVESSDGHTFHEIGENEQIEAILAELGIDGDQVLLNRNDDKLPEFIASRKQRRA